MKTFLLFCWCISSGYAQFVLIDSKDPKVLVRSSPQQTAKNIVDTLHQNAIAFVVGKEGNWLNISYETNQKAYTGYIPSSKAKFLSKLQVVPCTELAEKSKVFQADDISVTIAIADFQAKKHSLQYGNKTLETIDFKDIWGTDGTIPQSLYKKISIQIGKKQLNLPNIALQSLYEPNLKATEVYFAPQTSTLYLVANNGDGTGAYAVLWIVEKGNYQRRILEISF